MINDRVDLEFRAYVDAARWLVQNEHVGVGKEPLREDELLLVPAGQVDGRLFDARALDVQLLAVVVGDSDLARLAQDRMVLHAIQVGKRNVLLDVANQDQAVSLAILGDVGDPMLDRFGDRTHVDLHTVPERGAADKVPPRTSEHRSEERRVGKECRSRWSPY